MANETMKNLTRSNADVWIAVGVVACLGLGAGMTYWLSGADEGQDRKRPNVLALKGDPINGSLPVNGTSAAAHPAPPKAAPVSKADEDYPR